jgi:hypothetical protein
MNRKAALALSERALTFLSARPDDLQRFLTASGMDAEELIERHTEDVILSAALGFLAGDESLAEAFSKDENLKPGMLLNACAVLDPHGSSAW